MQHGTTSNASSVAALAFILIAALATGACTKEPAAVADLQLLRRALSDQHEYLAAVAQLEKNPKAAQRALREQSAPQGTREEFLLRLIADRVRGAGRYAAWDATMAKQSGKPLTDLVDDRHGYFWSEKLLFGDTASSTMGARHLVEIDSEVADAALALRVRDTGRDPDTASGIAAEGLARAGEVGALTRALGDWFAAADAHESTRARAVAQLRSAAEALPAKSKGAAEQQLLRELENPKLSIAGRRARLVVLEGVVRPGALERLAKLRRSMPAQLRAEMDAVLVAALSRDSELQRLGERGEVRP